MPGFRGLVKYLIAFFCSITVYVAAQGTGGAEGRTDTFAEFDTVFFYAFDVAEVDCPEGITADTCYVHGYEDFFAFKRVFVNLFSQALEPTQRWRFTEIEVGGDRVEVFRATYRFSENSNTFTLTYLPENFLFIER